MRRIFRDAGFLLLGSDIRDDRRDFLSADGWLWGHETEFPVMRSYSIGHRRVERLIGMVVGRVDRRQERRTSLGTGEIYSMARRASLLIQLLALGDPLRMRYRPLGAARIFRFRPISASAAKPEK